MADLDPTTENLRIAHLNICSLRHKIPDIHLFLTRYKIHVLALTETHLGTRIKNSELKIDHYKLYRCDRKHNNSNWYRGGVALYVQDHIPVKRHVFSNLSNIEIIWADIYLSHTKPVLIGCCYISKKIDFKYLEGMEISERDQTEKDVFLLGDFNKNCFSEDMLQIKLFSERCGLKQIVNSRTREENCIDHIYTNIPERCDTPRVIVTGCSDHNLAFVDVREKKVPQRISIQRSYSEFDENSFIQEIKRTSWSEVMEEEKPEKALSRFIEIFMPIANKHAPLKTDHPKPWWWSEDIICLILSRDRELASHFTRKAKSTKTKILEKFKKIKKERFSPESEEVPEIPTNMFNVFYQYYTDESPRFSCERLPLPLFQ